MSLASRSTRGALFLGASTISNIVVGFLGGIVLARLLAPNDFGTFALATTIYAFVDIRGKLQLEQKFLRDQDERPEYLDTFFTLNLALSAVSCLFLLAAAAGIALLVRRPDLGICLAVIGLVVLLEPFSLSVRLSLERQVAFGWVALIQSAANLTQFGTTLGCALAGLGLWSLPAGFASGIVLSLMLFVRVAPRRPRLRLCRPLAGELLHYGLHYGLGFALASIILTQFDNMILGTAGGTTALGFYDRAYRTSLWPTLLVSTTLGRISLPTYAKLREDPERLRQAFSLVLWTVLTLTTPIALALFATAPLLVPTLYGPAWLPSVPILQALAAFATLRPLWDDMVSVLVATGRSKQMVRLVLLQALFMVVLVSVLTVRLGSVGTAIGVGITFVISAGFVLYFGRAVLKIDLFDAAGLPLLNNLLALAAYWGVSRLLPAGRLPALAQLILEVGVFFFLYALISLITTRGGIIRRVHYLIRAARGSSAGLPA
jgi:O-antigen/teichoic acid export membrane protein